MKSKWMWAFLAVVVGAAVYGGNVLAATQSGVTTTFSKATLGDLDLRGQMLTTATGPTGVTHPDLWFALLKTHGLTDLYVVNNTIAPGGTTGWHSHPGPSLILVTAGTVTNYASDAPNCAPETYTAGQGFVDPGGSDVHMLRNEGTVPAQTIAVQFIPKDVARRIDAAAPANCSG
jgi:quercetin dioxygenase-like cupin family protein